VVPALGACSVGLLPFPTCVVRLVLHLPCPACGLTRAGLRFLHGDLRGATGFQPLALPLIALFLLSIALAPALGDAAWRRFTAVALGLAGGGLVLVWALRFLGLFGGPVPI
jgi:hypothetical protein